MYYDNTLININLWPTNLKDQRIQHEKHAINKRDPTSHKNL